MIHQIQITTIENINTIIMVNHIVAIQHTTTGTHIHLSNGLVLKTRLNASEISSLINANTQ